MVGGELAEDFADNGDNFALALFIESIFHVLNDGVESRNRVWTKVEDHDHLAFGQLVGVEPLYEVFDGARSVGNGLLGEGAGMCGEVLQDLFECQDTQTDLLCMARIHLVLESLIVLGALLFVLDPLVVHRVGIEVVIHLKVRENGRLRLEDLHCEF